MSLDVLLLAFFSIALLFSSATTKALPLDKKLSQGDLNELLLEAGSPMMRLFSPKEYDASIQNWAIVQSPSGLIYVGNTSGVLEFDGVTWRLIPVSNNTGVSSLAVDPNTGRIYVGAIGELGYLEPDEKGKMQYISLVHQIPEKIRKFASVWQTFFTDLGVVFSTFQRLYRFSDQGVESWKPKNSFHLSFHVGLNIYIRSLGRGLMELVDGQLKLVNGGERFATEPIYTVLPWPNTNSNSNNLLIGTRTQGFFIYDGSTFKPWLTEVDTELKRDLLYCGLVLPDGRLVFGTLQGGAYILDSKGRLLEKLDLKDGLFENSVIALMLDDQAGLWLALAKGLVRAEIGNNLSQFNESTGLEGSIYAVQRYHGILYVGTTTGLYRLNSGAEAKFTQVDDIQDLILDIKLFEDRLLVSSYNGLYEVTENSIHLIYPNTTFTSWTFNSKIYVGLRQGISVLNYTNGSWQDEGKIPGIEDEIRSFSRTKDDQVWVSTYSKGLLRLSFSQAGGNPTVERFDLTHGLPSLSNNGLRELEGELIFLTKKGIYYFDEASRQFKPKGDFKELFSDGQRHISDVAVDGDKGLWLTTLKNKSRLTEAGLLTRDVNNQYIWQPQSLSGIAATDHHILYQEQDGMLWVGGDDGLFRFNPAGNKSKPQPFQVSLRNVSAGNGRVLYSGGGETAWLQLPFTDNRLRFEFAGLSYDGIEVNQYQVRLEGAENEWPPWSKEAFKDYSNLWEGRYQLYIRAQNRYGVMVESKVYEFQILPPWYRSTLAYLFYVVMLAFIAWGVMRWRFINLKIQRGLLRKQVRERTRQLATLGTVGREITATLDLDSALESLYRNINLMLDAKIFGIGLYDKKKEEIEFRLAIENGVRYKTYKRKMSDKNQLAVWCVKHAEPVLIGNYLDEYKRYIEEIDSVKRTFSTGEGKIAKQRLSMIYVPIFLKKEVIGVIGIQSIMANAYHVQHIDLLQTMASYTAIAINNGRVHADLLTAYKTVEEVSVTDQLTGLKNRRFINLHFIEDIKKTLRDYENWKASLKMVMPEESDHVFFLLDLDHFKRVNDTYGHSAGDNVLVQIKGLLIKVFRNSDFLIRWGGEEFLVIARFIQRDSSSVLAERIRAAIEDHDFDIGDGQIIKMTSSIGFASFPFIRSKYDAMSWGQVVNIADSCLYMAKKKQRNAWVGVFADDDADSDEVLACLANKQKNLFKTNGIKVLTSINDANLSSI